MTTVNEALSGLDDFTIEVPSWAYGNSGTRFKVFHTAGVPRNPFEKIADAAQVNAVTGLAPAGVAAHPVGQGRLRRPGHARQGAGREHRRDQLEPVPGGGLQARLAHPRRRADRAKAVAHHLDCIAIMRETGSRDLKIWLPDGTNYAGQASLRARQERLADSLAQIYAALDDDQRLLLEYKFFEPYFYAMDIPDWGTSLLHCQALGERAQVVLDTGHHAPGTNIEFIVMQLQRVGKLGAFDFNSRYYADDDLVVGSADPFQLFRILNEIVAVDGHHPGRQNGGSTSCSTSATTSRRRSRARSVGAQRRAGAGQGSADRPRRAGGRRGGRRRARRPRRADGRLRHRRPRLLADRREARACRATRWPPTPRRATSSASPPSGSAGPRLPGVPDPSPSLPALAAAWPTGNAFCPSRHRDRQPDRPDLVARSNRLGADPRNTNYAGGNTSAKAPRPTRSPDSRWSWCG